MPNLQINGMLAVTPLVNTVLMGRDLLQGNVNLLMFAIVLISTALYGVLALAVASRIFGSDAVLYGSGGTLTELLKRPQETADVASIQTSMSCLAVVFSLFIIAGSIPSRLNVSLSDQLFKLDGPRSQRCLMEAVVSGSYPFLRMTIRESKFRSHYNCRHHRGQPRWHSSAWPNWRYSSEGWRYPAAGIQPELYRTAAQFAALFPCERSSEFSASPSRKRMDRPADHGRFRHCGVCIWHTWN